MTINGGAQFTNDPDVKLSVNAPGSANRLRVANDGGFRDAESFAVKKKIRWHLAESGRERLPKTVYLRFGSDSQNFTDDIILDQTNPTVTSATVDGTGAAATGAAVAGDRRSQATGLPRAGSRERCELGRREGAVPRAASDTRAPWPAQADQPLQGHGRAEVRPGEGPGRQLQPLADDSLANKGQRYPAPGRRWFPSARRCGSDQRHDRQLLVAQGEDLAASGREAPTWSRRSRVRGIEANRPTSATRGRRSAAAEPAWTVPVPSREHPHSAVRFREGIGHRPRLPATPARPRVPGHGLDDVAWAGYRRHSRRSRSRPGRFIRIQAAE